MSPTEPTEVRHLDMESLKGLAHPLRVLIFDTLATYGPFTASGLAERLGESSGATSYHLRQLARHGYVREVEGRGTGRERWWERVPGAIEVTTPDLNQTAAGRAAGSLVMREFNQNRERLVSAFTDHGYDLLPREWTDQASVTTINVRITSDQLAELTRAFEEFSRTHIEPLRGQNVAGSRPVQIHFNAFPVLDGVETPKEAEK
jgi:DNA-binding transcriptional ArsR family regulator